MYFMGPDRNINHLQSISYENNRSPRWTIKLRPVKYDDHEEASEVVFKTVRPKKNLIKVSSEKFSKCDLHKFKARNESFHTKCSYRSVSPKCSIGSSFLFKHWRFFAENKWKHFHKDLRPQFSKIKDELIDCDIIPRRGLSCNKDFEKTFDGLQRNEVRSRLRSISIPGAQESRNHIHQDYGKGCLSDNNFENYLPWCQSTDSLFQSLKLLRNCSVPPILRNAFDLSSKKRRRVEKSPRNFFLSESSRQRLFGIHGNNSNSLNEAISQQSELNNRFMLNSLFACVGNETGCKVDMRSSFHT